MAEHLTGCRLCGTQDTETVDGIHGRRCVLHPSTYDRRTALAMVDRGEPGRAFVYLRAHLAHQARSR